MLPQKDQATATDNMRTKFGEVQLCSFPVMQSDRDRQTDRQTNMLITVPCTAAGGKVKIAIETELQML